MNAFIITGRLSHGTGGPLATMSNIADALSASAVTPSIFFIQSNQGEPDFARAATHRPSNNYFRMWKCVTGQQAKPDVIVLVGVWHPAFALGILYSLLMRKVPLILVPTNSLMPWDWGKHGTAKELLRPLLNICMRRVAAVICASTGELDQSRPVPPGAGLVIPHAVSIPEHAECAPRQYFTGGDSARIAYIGRIDPQKDLALLLEGVSLVKNPIDLVIAGDGDSEYLRGLHELEASLKVSPRWLGQVSRDEALEIMRQADVVVVTSFAENFCHVAAEAASVGTRVLVPNRVASASDLAHSPAIEIFEPTPRNLASAMSTAIARGPLSPETREEARAYAISTWSLSTYRRNWERLLQRLSPALIGDRTRGAHA